MIFGPYKQKHRRWNTERAGAKPAARQHQQQLQEGDIWRTVSDEFQVPESPELIASADEDFYNNKNDDHACLVPRGAIFTDIFGQSEC